MSSNSAKNLIQIDVCADTMCPWCYVGKLNLDKAIASLNDRYNFEIKWHAYMLNRNVPKEGIVKKEYYLKKFGPRYLPMESQMIEHKLVEELWLGFFTHGKYIGNREFLVETAEKVGVEGAAEFLEDPNNGLKEVNEDHKRYSSRISGVPHFTINGKYELSGCQPPESFLRAFQAAESD